MNKQQGGGKDETIGMSMMVEPGNAVGDNNAHQNNKIQSTISEAALSNRTTTTTRPGLTWKNYVTEMKKELWKIILVALPSVLTQIHLYSLVPVTASVVGRTMESEEFAAFALAILVGNLTCWSILWGTLSAADTLLPRAFAARQHRVVGVLTMRCVVICAALLGLPILVLSQPRWTSTLLVRWGTDDQVAAFSAEWMQWYIVGIPATALFLILQRFCISQEQPWPPVQASVFIAFILHPLLVDQFVELYGFVGSAHAMVASQYTMLIVLVVILWVKKQNDQAFHSESWPQIRSGAFWQHVFQLRPMWDYLSLSVTGMVSMSEWWFWEIVSFMARNFGVMPFCAHSISYILVPLTFLVPYGLGVGLTVRVGTLLASSPSACHTALVRHEDSIRRAKAASATTLGLATLIGLIEAVALFLSKDVVVRLFTADPYVVKAVEPIWFLMCCYIVLRHIFAIQDAILRGLSLQWRSIMVIVVLLWCFGLPLIAYLTISSRWNLSKMWTMLVLLYTLVQLSLCCSYMIGVNWEELDMTEQTANTSKDAGPAEGIFKQYNDPQEDDDQSPGGVPVLIHSFDNRDLLFIARSASTTFGTPMPVNTRAAWDDEDNQCFVLNGEEEDEYRQIT